MHLRADTRQGNPEARGQDDYAGEGWVAARPPTGAEPLLTCSLLLPPLSCFLECSDSILIAQAAAAHQPYTMLMPCWRYMRI